jgi:hypothetical protein
MYKKKPVAKKKKLNLYRNFASVVVSAVPTVLKIVRLIKKDMIMLKINLTR